MIDSVISRIPGKVPLLVKSRTWWHHSIRGAREVMKIVLDVPNVTEHGMYYVGNRPRLATVTAVKFISDSLLVASHLVGQSLFLIQFNRFSGQYKVLQMLETQANGNRCSTDLLDYNEKDLILTSNCEHMNASLYQIENHCLTYLETVEMPGIKTGFCHGAKFVSWHPDWVCLATTTGERNLAIIDIQSSKLIYTWNDADWKPKDICFPAPQQVAIMYSMVPARKELPAAHVPYVSKIQLIEIDSDFKKHRILSETFIEGSHLDGCHFSGNQLYVPSQMYDLVHVFKFTTHQFYHIYDLKGYNFPHGIDIDKEHQLMAVTNYGDHSIYLRRL